LEQEVAAERPSSPSSPPERFDLQAQLLALVEVPS